MNKAIFVDRDGVINRDLGYVGTIERFEFLPGVIEALVKLKSMGYLTVVVTNQSGIARGMYTVDDYYKVMEYMQDELKKHNAQFDAIYFCPHHPHATVPQFRCDCSCRKPKADMFLWAAKEHDIDLASSIMVGDHATDIMAAQNAHVGRAILVGEHLHSDGKLVPHIEQFADLLEFTNSLEQGA